MYEREKEIVCVYACVSVSVCEREREGEWCLNGGTFKSSTSSTHKGLVHGALDFIRAVRVDLLEELVERSVSLQLLVLLLLFDVSHQLVPVACVGAG